MQPEVEKYESDIVSRRVYQLHEMCVWVMQGIVHQLEIERVLEIVVGCCERSEKKCFT